MLAVNWHRIWARLAFAPLSNVVWKYPAETGKIYLTFDDGPDPKITPEVLEVLNQAGVPGTFFLSGAQIRKHRMAVQEWSYAGHLLGIHCYHHRAMACLPAPVLHKEVELTAKLIGRIFRQSATLCRPPYGIFARSFYHLLQRRGYRMVLWSLMAYDFSLSPQQTLERLVRLSRPGDIVVFHDNPLAANSVRYALPRFIEYCQRRGWGFGVPLF